MQIGLIGYGRLGKLITKYLGQDVDLKIFDSNMQESDITEISNLGHKVTGLKELCKCPIIIPCVPISEFENVIKSISEFVNSSTLIIDVCSVKEHPVTVMKKNLPKDVSILGTHPMFGPDSAKNTLYGSKIVLCKVNIEEEIYRNIKNYLETHGLKVIESTPEEHDKQISSSLLLTHLIGRTLMDYDASDLDIDTKGYRRLLKILETVQNDSWQLFVDMNKYNPYAKEASDRFLDSLTTVKQRVENG